MSIKLQWKDLLAVVMRIIFQINVNKNEEVTDLRSVGIRALLFTVMTLIRLLQYLGVHIDIELQWHKHVSSVCIQEFMSVYTFNYDYL